MMEIFDATINISYLTILSNIIDHMIWYQKSIMNKTTIIYLYHCNILHIMIL